MKVDAAVVEEKGSPLLGHEGAGDLRENRLELAFDEIDRAAHDAETGAVVKPVLRMT